MAANRMNRRAVLLLLVGVLAVCLFAAPTSQAIGPEEKPSGDLKAYAALWEVDSVTAANQIALEVAAGELEGRLRSHEPSFAGLWIDHQPQFRVEVASTRDVDLAAYTKGGVLEGRVSSVRVSRSATTLDKIADEVRPDGIVPFDVSIDIKANKVVILTENLDELGAFMQAGGLKLPDGVEVVQVELVAQPMVDIYGGVHLSACTAGFVVRKAGTTTDGIVTAGHCGPNQSYAGVSLPFQAPEAFNGSHDEQWHTTPGLTDVAKFRWHEDGSTRLVTGRVFYVNQPVGSTVCKYGKITGYDCAVIIAKNLAPGYVPNAAPTFIRSRNLHLDMASPGDSGGPVFFAGNAYGIVSGSVSGGPDTDDLIHVAENYIETGLNVTVRTN